MHSVVKWIHSGEQRCSIPDGADCSSIWWLIILSGLLHTAKRYMCLVLIILVLCGGPQVGVSFGGRHAVFLAHVGTRCCDRMAVKRNKHLWFVRKSVSSVCQNTSLFQCEDRQSTGMVWLWWLLGAWRTFSYLNTVINRFLGPKTVSKLCFHWSKKKKTASFTSLEHWWIH